ncbi:hypothetical protein [Streptomyces carpinensis]|uniref:Transposase Helix-turn-helix domain-containing protein n=1 Tax=Streptomyces carpinensis TaxID=66369 RepID=A0ABV1VX42_9ACTN|nr:hypothetical protein [Streptomyces carpinensis]
MLAYRTNLTMQQLGSLFGSSHAAAHRVLACLAEPLAKLLGPPPTDRRELWVVDGTLIPTCSFWLFAVRFVVVDAR